MFYSRIFRLHYLAVLILLIVLVTGVGSAAAVNFSATQKDVGYGSTTVSDLDVTAVDYVFNNSDPSKIDQIDLTFATNINQVKISVTSPAVWTDFTCTIAANVATCTPGAAYDVTSITTLSVAASYDAAPIP